MDKHKELIEKIKALPTGSTELGGFASDVFVSNHDLKALVADYEDTVNGVKAVADILAIAEPKVADLEAENRRLTERLAAVESELEEPK